MATGAAGCGYTGSYIFSQTIFTMRAGVYNRWNGWVVALSEYTMFALPFPGAWGGGAREGRGLPLRVQGRRRARGLLCVCEGEWGRVDCSLCVRGRRGNEVTSVCVCVCVCVLGGGWGGYRSGPRRCSTSPPPLPAPSLP